MWNLLGTKIGTWLIGISYETRQMTYESLSSSIVNVPSSIIHICQSSLHNVDDPC